MVAIKTIRFSGDQRKLQREVIQIKQEIDLMKTLTHSNVVKYLYTDILNTYDGVDIILEYVSAGSIR